MAPGEIVITVGGVRVDARLNDSRIASLIMEKLPLEADARTWGEEIYFQVPVRASLDRPVEEVSEGDIAFWGQGSAFCVFFGETPVSSGGRIIPAGPVEIIGRVTSGLERLAEAGTGDSVRIERKGG